jgi:hypothetical protein
VLKLPPVLLLETIENSFTSSRTVIDWLSRLIRIVMTPSSFIAQNDTCSTRELSSNVPASLVSPRPKYRTTASA